MDDDTKRHDYLQTLKLPAVLVYGRPVAVRYADIPLDLRLALDEFQITAARPLINGELCVWLNDWQRFLLYEMLRHHADMQPRALERGAIGPSEDDLASAPILTNWLIFGDSVQSDAYLWGTPEGHPTCKGPLMRSSPLCGLDPQGKWARTVSRWYRLERMLAIDEFVDLHGPAAAQFQERSISIDQALEIIREGRKHFKTSAEGRRTIH